MKFSASLMHAGIGNEEVRDALRKRGHSIVHGKTVNLEEAS